MEGGGGGGGNNKTSPDDLEHARSHGQGQKHQLFHSTTNIIIATTTACLGGYITGESSCLWDIVYRL